MPRAILRPHILGISIYTLQGKLQCGIMDAVLQIILFNNVKNSCTLKTTTVERQTKVLCSLTYICVWFLPVCIDKLLNAKAYFYVNVESYGLYGGRACLGKVSSSCYAVKLVQRVSDLLIFKIALYEARPYVLTIKSLRITPTAVKNETLERALRNVLREVFGFRVFSDNQFA